MQNPPVETQPALDQVFQVCVLVVVGGHEVVLPVSSDVVRFVFKLNFRKPLQVVDGRINQMAQDFFFRPFGGAGFVFQFNSGRRVQVMNGCFEERF